MPTGQEMCEYIVKTFPNLGTPEEVWNASPDGTLEHVFSLYASAREQNGLPAFEDPKMQALFESFVKSEKRKP